MKTKMEQGWSMGGVPTNPWRPVPTVVFALSPEELGQLSGRGHNEVAPSLDAAMALRRELNETASTSQLPTVPTPRPGDMTDFPVGK